MEIRELGDTGIRASVERLGCNNFGMYQDAAKAVAVVRKALDGLTPFATMEANYSILVRDVEKEIIQ